MRSGYTEVSMIASSVVPVRNTATSMAAPVGKAEGAAVLAVKLITVGSCGKVGIDTDDGRLAEHRA